MKNPQKDASLRQIDVVDSVLDEWKKERPDLDPSPIRIFATAALIGRLVEEFYEASASEFGILGTDFFLLAELRRMGEPFECSPGRLSQIFVRSTGGTTKQLDRLESAGLVVRVANPDDRRSNLVRLTPDGLKLIDAALETHFRSEAEILEGETEEDIGAAVALLSRMSDRLRLRSKS